MKLLKRIIILIIAGALGASVYMKFLAVETVVTQSQQAVSQNPTYDNGSAHFKGGIGPVGNPYANKPLGKPPQQNRY